MTTQVQQLPSLPKENYNLINPPSQLFKPVPIRKSENSFPISTKTSSPNNHIIYPNFGFGSYSTFNFNSLGNLQNYLLSQEKKVKVDVKNKPCCNCLKTKCMKKYCECLPIINYAKTVFVLIAKIKVRKYLMKIIKKIRKILPIITIKKTKWYFALAQNRDVIRNIAIASKKIKNVTLNVDVLIALMLKTIRRKMIAKKGLIWMKQDVILGRNL